MQHNEKLIIREREKIAIYLAQGLTRYKIAQLLGRNKATITRELKRNSGEYSPSKAQAACVKRRRNIGQFMPECSTLLSKGYVSNRGKIPISHELSERLI